MADSVGGIPFAGEAVCIEAAKKSGTSKAGKPYTINEAVFGFMGGTLTMVVEDGDLAFLKPGVVYFLEGRLRDGPGFRIKADLLKCTDAAEARKMAAAARAAAAGQRPAAA